MTKKAVLTQKLRQQVGAALENGRVLLFSAPCGFGKTTAAQQLISGMTPGAILEEIEDEQERARAARIFQKDSGADAEQELRMAGDCLRILHRKRIEQHIAELTAQLPGLKGEDKRSTLLKIQELTKERQTAGRKE